MVETVTEETLEQELQQFIGSEQNYFMPGRPQLEYTQGVRYLAERAGAWWLLELVLSVMHKPVISSRDRRSVKLERNKKGNGAVFRIMDEDEELYVQKIPYTDFPMKSITLLFDEVRPGVSLLYLLSEY